MYSIIVGVKRYILWFQTVRREPNIPEWCPKYIIGPDSFYEHRIFLDPVFPVRLFERGVGPDLLSKRMRPDVSLNRRET